MSFIKVPVEEILDLQQAEMAAKSDKLIKTGEGFTLGSCLDFLDDY